MLTGRVKVNRLNVHEIHEACYELSWIDRTSPALNLNASGSWTNFLRLKLASQLIDCLNLRKIWLKLISTWRLFATGSKVVDTFLPRLYIETSINFE